MAQPSWAPKRKAGESEGSYKKRFYSMQREHAEETGDQATTDKIYKKLGRKSHSVDADAVNKGILGAVAGSAGIGKLGSAARGAKVGKALGAGVQDLGKARPVQGTKALPRAQKMLPAPKKMLSAGKSEAKASAPKGRVSGVVKGKGGKTTFATKTRTKPSVKSGSYFKQSTGKGVKSSYVKKGKKNA
jgi:hypothetical protein